MSNERLRSQLTATGFTLDRLAQELEVDPKTVERWITKERLPHRRHRWKTADLLGCDEAYLWPQVMDQPQTQDASRAEFVTLYPHRGAVSGQLWQELIAKASTSVDILVYAGLFLVDSFPDLPQTLAAKAHQGTRCRVLLGDPDSDVVRRRGLEEGIGENLSARIRLSRTYLEATGAVPGLEIREHSSILYNSLYRFDDQLLVNMHVYGAPAPQNPVMHLRRIPGGRLFDHYLGGFDRVWSDAVPLAEEAVA